MITYKLFLSKCLRSDYLFYSKLIYIYTLIYLRTGLDNLRVWPWMYELALYSIVLIPIFFSPYYSDLVKSTAECTIARDCKYTTKII